MRRLTTARWAVIAAAAALAIGGCQATPTPSASPSEPSADAVNTSDGLLQLDASKNYGDRYADGILPVGDEKWSITAPSVGTVFLCNDNFVADSQAGAQTRGPWFTNDNTQWNSGVKASIAGSVSWDAQFSLSGESDAR